MLRYSTRSLSALVFTDVDIRPVPGVLLLAPADMVHALVFMEAEEGRGAIVKGFLLLCGIDLGGLFC